MRQALTLTLLSLLASSCARDDLTPIPQDENTPLAVVPGVITGQVCNRDLGVWRSGVDVSITLTDGSKVVQTTDSEGRFTFNDVPPGSYYVHLEGESEDNDLSAVVQAGTTTTIGQTVCQPPAGNLKGRVCNETTGLWVEGATVTLDDATGSTTTTDMYGKFKFLSLLPGTYTISVTAPGYTGTRTAEVLGGATTDIGPSSCIGGDGGVSGRICGGDGYWLSAARVWVDLGGGAFVETTTDADGYYTLTGVPDGNWTIYVEHGSFSTSFPVTVTAGNVTNLSEPVCIPPTTQVAVVTGDWDEVEHVLANLGFAVRNVYNSTTPIPQDPSGNVDLIAGAGTDFWVDEFLSDPTWMAKYDIIFLNCGVQDYTLTSGGAVATTALSNLQDFVSSGGSLYASDWASEAVRLAFPGRINFYGNEANPYEPRVGDASPDQGAEVTDSGLRTALGRTNVVINFNLDVWVVMDTQSSQASDLRILVRGDVPYSTGLFGTSAHTMNDAPIVVQFTMGSGRVLYTSAHNEGQNTPDLEDILNYIIFEL